MDRCELWPGGPVLETGPGAEPVCTDSVLLSAFPSLAGVRRCADLGCGSGLIAILLAARSPRIAVDCVEISPSAAELARRNIAANGLDSRLRVLERDLRDLRQAEVGRYDLIVTNPPYFAAGSGTSPDPSRRTAREELTCTLPELASAAARLLGDGGRLALVYPVSRLAEAICRLSAAGLEPKRLRFVEARPGAAPSLALIECRRNGRPGLAVEPALTLKTPGGADTPEVRRIYHLEP